MLIAENNLTALLIDTHRAGEAVPLFLGLIETAQRALPPGHWMTSYFRGVYGGCLTELGRYDEAESLLLASYEDLEASLGDEHQLTRKTRRRVVGLFDAWGKPGKKAEFLAIVGQ